jgi:hypothetical protein
MWPPRRDDLGEEANFTTNDDTNLHPDDNKGC